MASAIFCDFREVGNSAKIKPSKKYPMFSNTIINIIIYRGPPQTLECKLCNVQTTNQEQMDAHVRGSKHQNKIRQKKQEKDPARDYPMEGPPPRGPWQDGGRGGGGRGFRGGGRGDWGRGGGDRGRGKAVGVTERVWEGRRRKGL